MNNTVVDGKATPVIDTTGLSEGKYKLQIRYKENNYYKQANTETTLTLTRNTTRTTTIPTDDTTQWTSDNGTNPQTRTALGRTGVIGVNDTWCRPINLTLDKDTDYDISVDIYTTAPKGYMEFGLIDLTRPVTEEQRYNRYYSIYCHTYYSSESTWRYIVDDTLTIGSTGDIGNIPANTWNTILFKKRGYNIYVTYTDSNGRVYEDMPCGVMKANFTFFVKQWGYSSCASNLVITEYL